MTIPTRDEALKALDKLSSDYDLAGGWTPDPMPLLAALRSYIESHTGEVVSHEWHERFGLTCCKVCGFVRNENSDTKGCRGPVYVSLRDASPVQPDPITAYQVIEFMERETGLPFGDFIGMADKERIKAMAASIGDK